VDNDIQHLYGKIEVPTRAGRDNVRGRAGLLHDGGNP
jgi:hypothetical protein